MAPKSNTLILGPPDLHYYGNPMVDSVQAGVGDLQLTAIEPIIPQLGLGFPKSESNTGNPCLDLFFYVLPSTPSYSLVDMLAKSWSYDPLTTLKLVCNLRGVRGTGKSDRESFYRSALWLHKNHPKTLAGNVRVFAEFGCYKDLVEILYRLLEEEKPKKESKGKWLNRRIRKPERKENVRFRRKERKLSKAKKGYERYCNDSVYRFLHDCIADMFAHDLKKDIEFLNSGDQVRKISLASKWCPSIGSAYDVATLICESIAKRIFPRESDPDYDGIEEAHYAFRVRDRLRKQVLVPLHKALELPELYMCSKQWDSLPYNKVSSVAMKYYNNKFLQKDSQRFRRYIEDVKKDDESIASGALLPHEIIASLKDAGEVAVLQWRTMVEGLKKKGKLNNCIALCDVSDRMTGTPMEVSVALGLMISELSEEPWKGKVITFGSSPELHLIKGDCLLSKSKCLSETDGGENVDFEQVFDRMLQVAVQGKLNQDQMIKRVFVFSGLEFDEAYDHHLTRLVPNHSNGHSNNGSSYCYTSSEEDDSMAEDDDWYAISEVEQKKLETKRRELMKRSWESMYGRIHNQFEEKGFNVPEIVFWNLKNSPAISVPCTQTGVALISGFSKNLLALFLDNGGIVDPVTVMEHAISGDLYQKLSVYD